MKVRSIGAFTLIASLLIASVAMAAPPLSGAIFTTTVDGTIVNENVRYEAKEDVYLDGGPGPNAPSSAAGLPEGDYYFQVTDPSGKDLLSTDSITCRKFHVGADGFITYYYSDGTNFEKVKGTWTATDCVHGTGVDIDYGDMGAITVQLFPYDDTPNKGGVYKVWATPVEDYEGTIPDCAGTTGQCNVNGEDYQPGNFHGFIPAASKTDNYKVKKQGPPYITPEITVRKFHDKNFNGVWDMAEEEEVTGWAVDVTDPLGTTNTEYTPETILAAEAGDYTFEESTPAGTLQTASYLDNAIVSQYPTADPTVIVSVLGDSGETHEVLYGNVGLGEITACKVYDSNGNGEADEGELGLEGWKMELWSGNGDAEAGDSKLAEGYTGAEGCVTFGDLKPGTYTVFEIMPNGDAWISTGSTYGTFEIVSTLNGSVMSGGSFEITFTNYCVGYADFGTKGYWHNKNGLQELTEADRDYVNSLSPYSSPSDYFDAGDEPFDGMFTDGTPVESALGDGVFQGEEVAAAGSWQAEISLFLTDANAGSSQYYHKEQLAQQLLAFIFNVRHRLDGADATIVLPDGSWASAQSLIDAAIAAWESGDADAISEMEGLLDALNNSDYLPYIHAEPCEIIY